MNTFKGNKICRKKKKPHTLPIRTKRVVFFLLQVITFFLLNSFKKKIPNKKNKKQKKGYEGSVRKKKFADIFQYNSKCF